MDEIQFQKASYTAESKQGDPTFDQIFSFVFS